ncbi:hypothetical protein JVT61DRAFT_3948 [Boletus reticuloceps]|uniref:Uncharacterized protein n=1 Tax=Boletus reticuloceps TaxID=495285 RepID=A0A8I2YMB9_9AGAM|nr:hypothetical protein JVT61DRAFT_3948 [Boletus reticuloceps]
MLIKVLTGHHSTYKAPSASRPILSHNAIDPCPPQNPDLQQMPQYPNRPQSITPEHPHQSILPTSAHPSSSRGGAGSLTPLYPQPLVPQYPQPSTTFTLPLVHMDQAHLDQIQSEFIPLPQLSGPKKKLTKEETTKAKQHAREALLKIMGSLGALFSAAHDTMIKSAMATGITKETVVTDVELPRNMQKDTVHCMGNVCHIWKDICLLCVLSDLGLQQPIKEPTLPVNEVKIRANGLLDTFSFL